MDDCPYCLEAQAGGYDEDGKCCPSCPGEMKVSDSPEVNLSNVNAAEILAKLDLSTEDLSGRVEARDLGDFRRRIFRAWNGDLDRMVREPYTIPGGSGKPFVMTDSEGVTHIQRMGATVHYGGNSLDQIRRRLQQLDQLAQYAQENGFALVWG